MEVGDGCVVAAWWCGVRQPLGRWFHSTNPKRRGYVGAACDREDPGTERCVWLRVDGSMVRCLGSHVAAVKGGCKNTKEATGWGCVQKNRRVAAHVKAKGLFCGVLSIKTQAQGAVSRRAERRGGKVATWCCSSITRVRGEVVHSWVCVWQPSSTHRRFLGLFSRLNQSTKGLCGDRQQRGGKGEGVRGFFVEQNNKRMVFGASVDRVKGRYKVVALCSKMR